MTEKELEKLLDKAIETLKISFIRGLNVSRDSKPITKYMYKRVKCHRFFRPQFSYS